MLRSTRQMQQCMHIPEVYAYLWYMHQALCKAGIASDQVTQTMQFPAESLTEVNMIALSRWGFDQDAICPDHTLQVKDLWRNLAAKTVGIARVDLRRPT